MERMSKNQHRAYKVSCAGCVVYRRRENKIEFLLARRQGSQWMVPRGKLASDERPRAAAVREVLEETGVRVKAGIEIGSYTYPIGKARYKHVLFYAATPLSGTPTPDGKEFSEVAWVPADRVDVAPRDAVLLETVCSMVDERVLG